MNDELKIKNNELGGKMNYRYRTDEEMKDSGVEWIGKIPKEWSIVKGKYLFKNKKLKNSGGLNNILSLTLNGVIDRDKNNFEGLQPESFDGYQEFNNDNLVFKLIDLENINTSRVGYVHKDGLMSPAYIRLEKNKDIHVKYYYYNYFDYYNQKIYNFLGSVGVRSALNSSDLVEMDVINNKLIEQEKIAKFLDEKTAQFDSIISKKEALIEKLEEAKKSLISEVVTGKVRVVKTNDGYELVERKKEEMKDSGVEWLGDIPMGWNVSKIKHISSINSNVLSENTDEEYEIKYIDIGSVTSDGRIIGLQEYKFKDAPSRARRIVNDKDILISTVRTYLKAITSIEKSDENLICSTGFAVLSPSENIDYKFLSYFIRGNKFIDEVVSRSVGVSYPAITSSEIANLEVIIPSLNEQIKIGNYIDNKINKLNSIISNTQNQIDKIKEAKQSLISEAVTGKIEILD